MKDKGLVVEYKAIFFMFSRLKIVRVKYLIISPCLLRRWKSRAYLLYYIILDLNQVTEWCKLHSIDYMLSCNNDFFTLVATAINNKKSKPEGNEIILRVDSTFIFVF